jgi:site-specific DNA-methyltransferase (adenine-specific)
MGKGWDKSGIANNVDLWKEALRVLKPGGHLLAFSGSRTYHRMVCAIEDAGFEIRDQIMWLYGSGFPKSQNVGKALDKAAGAERQVIGHHTAGRKATPKQDVRGGRLHAGEQTKTIDLSAITAPATDAAKEWDGWGTALKPAHEPICVARKPFKGTVANNVLAHRTGAINIDGCRVGTESTRVKRPPGSLGRMNDDGWTPKEGFNGSDLGRWPANVTHDGSDEVLAAFPDARSSGGGGRQKGGLKNNVVSYGEFKNPHDNSANQYLDKGSAARFFYCAKASKKDRDDGLESFEKKSKAHIASKDGGGGGWSKDAAKNPNLPRANIHPTVKPTDLMRYLVRLVTPPNGIVLDPFMGSGSTGKACMLEGFKFAGIDMTPEYVEISRARIKHARKTAEPKTQNLFNKEKK